MMNIRYLHVTDVNPQIIKALAMKIFGTSGIL
jgi:hypothetical protein